MSSDIGAGIEIGVQFGDTTLPEWVKDPARRTVARNARSVDDARQLLEMLGLIEPIPTAATGTLCSGECGRTLRTPADEDLPDTVLAYAGDKCEDCHRASQYPLCAGGCGKHVRGTRAPDTPGTVRMIARGMCGGCYRGRKKAAA